MNKIKKIMKKVEIKVSFVFNFLLLSIVYFLGIGPTAVIAKISGKSFLSINNGGKVKTSFAEFKKSNNLEKMF